MSANSHDIPPVDDVLHSRPQGLLDPEIEPEPLECRDCGKPHPWSWWAGRGAIRARWCPPKVSPCAACQRTRDELAALSEHNRRMEAGGIPVVHRAFSWERVLYEEADEAWADFVRRTKRAPGTIGVSLRDHEAARRVREWKPQRDGFLLTGPVGSGKSLWVAALLSDLLRPTDEQAISLDEATMVRRLGIAPERAAAMVQHGLNNFRRPAGRQLADVHLTDEEEIVRRVELSWKGDQVPLLQIARADVLAYDDIGTVLIGGGAKARELARTCISRLVDLRWREKRPMLATSNRTLGEICEHLDARTSSRLGELLSTEILLKSIPDWAVERGYDWRRIP